MKVDWAFPAFCTKVIDGDTIDVIMDVGFHCTRTERLRLLGVNCPEVHGPSAVDGMRAKQFTQATLSEWMVTGVKWPLVVQTFKADVFGRYLARVWPADTLNGSPDLSSLLLASNNAVPFNG
jgi:micrococcal nuclease